jgi:hypothetical protein
MALALQADHLRWEHCVSLPTLKFNLMAVGGSRTYLILICFDVPSEF